MEGGGDEFVELNESGEPIVGPDVEDGRAAVRKKPPVRRRVIDKRVAQGPAGVAQGPAGDDGVAEAPAADVAGGEAAWAAETVPEAGEPAPPADA